MPSSEPEEESRDNESRPLREQGSKDSCARAVLPGCRTESETRTKTPSVSCGRPERRNPAAV
jgi:hypothetical protein